MTTPATPETALAAARDWWAAQNPRVVVDRLVEDDTHYAVCIRREPGPMMVGGPILFIRKANGALEPGGSADGYRASQMRELS